MRLQDLPRHLARRCLGIPNFCRESLGVEVREARLLVAYSTGLDSTALLHLMHLLRAPLNLTIFAAHAHHGLRPESDQELEHAIKTCQKLGIPCATSLLDVPALQAASGEGMEECARKARYAFLESSRVNAQADWIVTAHHGDDLAEDIVMRLLRGTGWPGLGGMAGVDPGRRLLRPLLDWNKSELQAFLEETGITWREDPSNCATDRTRNRVRHEVLPLLRRENPSFAKTTRQLWELARIDAQYWEKALPEILPPIEEYLLRQADLEVHQALRLRIYKSALDAMGPGQALAHHLLLLDKAWMRKNCGRSIQFPGDKIARVEAEGIRFYRQSRER
jgi:tRNA(Ile)-lysidine synthase